MAIEKIKKPPLRRLSRQLPSRGALRDIGVPSNTDEMCVGEGEPLLEERCHGVTEWWQESIKNIGVVVATIGRH